MVPGSIASSRPRRNNDPIRIRVNGTVVAADSRSLEDETFLQEVLNRLTPGSPERDISPGSGPEPAVTVELSRPFGPSGASATMFFGVAILFFGVVNFVPSSVPLLLDTIIDFDWPHDVELLLAISTHLVLLLAASFLIFTACFCGREQVIILIPGAAHAHAGGLGLNKAESTTGASRHLVGGGLGGEGGAETGAARRPGEDEGNTATSSSIVFAVNRFCGRWFEFSITSKNIQATEVQGVVINEAFGMLECFSYLLLLRMEKDVARGLPPGTEECDHHIPLFREGVKLDGLIDVWRKMDLLLEHFVDGYHAGSTGAAGKSVADSSRG